MRVTTFFASLFHQLVAFLDEFVIVFVNFNLAFSYKFGGEVLLNLGFLLLVFDQNAQIRTVFPNRLRKVFIVREQNFQPFYFVGKAIMKFEIAVIERRKSLNKLFDGRSFGVVIDEKNAPSAVFPEHDEFACVALLAIADLRRRRIDFFFEQQTEKIFVFLGGQSPLAVTRGVFIVCKNDFVFENADHLLPGGLIRQNSVN